ncbi:RING-type domain-containing protein [Fusarium keratoplasticum]|uniref:RING-type domain-containing protein n=1 Tax=Fusarium keratoplasticum TaxID=1328300 RepID=A0ACC0QQP6_9HYPO|nr:RING-type domain-containing protein [Fusarium keratoplasticum]KAI8663491.1 RING-type domain-containing protein [Fusarium keratoplasticum]
MSSSKTFLELQSNAPGLPGPYLVENLAPYKILDDLGTAKPKAILAIGSSCKRRFVMSNFFVNHGHRDWSVGLACQPDNTLIFDCELHLQDDDGQGMPRFQARRPWGGGLHGHVLEHAERGAAHIAYKLYGEVLAPFSDVILVFVPDLGFGEVVELFCRWFKSAMENKFPKGQRILLLHENMPQVQHVHSRLVAAFASMLRSSDALKAYTNADLRQRSSEAFHITNIALGSSTLTSEIDRALADSVLRRAGHCLDFKAPHFKYLLQTAIRHHAEQPSGAFDVISASRLLSHLSPDGLRDALGEFLGSRRDVGRTDVALVASALVLDAYPAGAHWFPPGLVFEYFYREATEHWGRRMRRPEFSQDVKVKFITIATNNQNASLFMVLSRFRGVLNFSLVQYANAETRRQ